MSTTAEILQAQKRKLQKTLDNKASIKQSLSNKRGKDVGENQSTWASEIDAIEPLLDTLDITENGNYNVKDYKNVEVGIVSQGDQPYINLIEGNVTEFTIPYGTKKIIDRMFYAYSNLNLHLPNSLESIGSEIIGSPSGATRLNFYFSGNFAQWLNIQKGTKSNKGFISGTNTNINLYVNNNEKIEGTYTLPRTVTELPIGSLSHIHFGGTANTNYKLTIPKEITKINRYAFYITKGVNEIEFEDYSISITLGEYAFSYLGYLDSASLKKIKLPYCEVLPSYLLSYCQCTEIIVSEGTKTIEKRCFENCNLTTTFSLPTTLTTINDQAFYGASGFKELIIPKNVTKIGGRAFNSANQTFIIESETPPTISSDTFYNKSGLKIYVKKGTRETFISATNWSSLANYTFEKYVVVMNIPSALLNNDTITYSIDGGKTYQMFTNGKLSLNEVATIKIKSTDSSQTILIGTTAGGNDVGTIANSELTFSFTTDTNVYLTIQ